MASKNVREAAMGRLERRGRDEIGCCEPRRRVGGSKFRGYQCVSRCHDGTVEACEEDIREYCFAR